jgi:hypothetical protein
MVDVSNQVVSSSPVLETQSAPTKEERGLILTVLLTDLPY